MEDASTVMYIVIHVTILRHGANNIIGFSYSRYKVLLSQSREHSSTGARTCRAIHVGLTNSFTCLQIDPSSIAEISS